MTTFFKSGYFFTSFSKSSSYPLERIWVVCSLFILYSFMNLSCFLSGISGRLFCICFIFSFVIFTGFTSVSGYILAAPGIGRIYSVVSSGSALLTSCSTPSKEIFALLLTASSALSTVFSFPIAITKASSFFVSKIFSNSFTCKSVRP